MKGRIASSCCSIPDETERETKEARRGTSGKLKEVDERQATVRQLWGGGVAMGLEGRLGEKQEGSQKKSGKSKEKKQPALGTIRARTRTEIRSNREETRSAVEGEEKSKKSRGKTFSSSSGDQERSPRVPGERLMNRDCK